MPTTANDLINSAMRKAGIITADESPTASEANDALDVLNDLFDSLSNDSLNVYSRVTESFTLSGGVAAYTIGTGADFDTARPIKIVSAYVRLGSVDYDVSLVTDEAYSNLSVKSISGVPDAINYDNAFPQGTIKFYPVPSSSYTFFLVSEKPLSNVTLFENLSLPPGWLRYLKNALAVELAAEYGVQTPQETAIIAERALGAIRRGVARSKTMDVMNVSKDGDIYTGWTK
jgi:hypothetical protein